MRTLFLTSILLAATSVVHAQEAAGPLAREQDEEALPGGRVSPYSPLVRGHLYAHLYKSPARALGYELLVPGLGLAYAGFKAQAILSAASSLLGAGLWLGGALADNDALMYAGVGTFAAARVYGAVAAPTSAAMLNAAFRRRLGVSLALRF